ncbi:MAG: hypothetical protein KAH17_05530 [Bacteroidales bacterium]|nr:hypothetical protein [Bacteroidales bacterium]
MKSRLYNYKTAIIASLILLIGVSGCNYFSNPLIDEESGESVKLLVVDLNFINTKLALHLQDIETNESIPSEEIEIFFIGDDADDVITFVGTKPEKFTTSSSFLEVGIDPNITVSKENPIELTVVAVGDNYISAPMALSYTTEGSKNVIIKLINIGTKSGSTGAYSEPYDIKFGGVLDSDQLDFKGSISTTSTGTAYEYLNLYRTLSAGTLICENISDPQIYADFGAYYVGLLSGQSLVPPAVPTKDAALGTPDMVYTSVLRTGVEKCDDGLTIKILESESNEGSGSFNYLITYSDETTDEGIVSGTFPIEVLIDNIYYPTSNPAVSVEVFEDAQYDMSAPVSLTSPCGAEANFTATIKSNLKTYKYIVRYTCPDSPIAIALSIRGEFRKTDTTGDWTAFEFVEGVTELQLEADEDYDFRINIDGESYEYSLPTDPDQLQQFLDDNQDAEFYTITSIDITETNTLVTIEAEVQLSGDICDIL